MKPQISGEKFRETGIVFVDLAVGGVEPELRGLGDEDRDVGAGRGLEVEGRGAVLEKPETSVCKWRVILDGESYLEMLMRMENITTEDISSK